MAASRGATSRPRRDDGERERLNRRSWEEQHGGGARRRRSTEHRRVESSDARERATREMQEVRRDGFRAEQWRAYVCVCDEDRVTMGVCCGAGGRWLLSAVLPVRKMRESEREREKRRRKRESDGVPTDYVLWVRADARTLARGFAGLLLLVCVCICLVERDAHGVIT